MSDYALKDIYNMDEIGLFYRMLPEKVPPLYNANPFITPKCHGTTPFLDKAAIESHTGTSVGMKQVLSSMFNICGT